MFILTSPRSAKAWPCAVIHLELGDAIFSTIPQLVTSNMRTGYLALNESFQSFKYQSPFV